MEYINFVALLSTLGAIVLVYLNYKKEVASKRAFEQHVKKIESYEKFISNLNDSLYSKEYQGWELNAAYHSAFIWASDDVIRALNGYFATFKDSSSVPRVEIKDTIANILVECRKDIYGSTTITRNDYGQIYK